MILDDLGLLPAFEFLAQGISKRTGLAITIEGSIEGRLAPAVETALYRVVQEALTNAGKHARATRLTVHVRPEGPMIGCTIQDDGVGFDLTTRHAQRDHPCLGLIGMRERLAALGGTLSITTGPGHGTTLEVRVPREA